MFDTHAHLHDVRLERDLDGVLTRARQVGVRSILAVGADFAQWDKTLAIAGTCEGVSAAVGCHPHDAKSFTDQTEKTLRAVAASGRVVAVGETGLDFHYDNSPRDVQIDVFRRQLRIAVDTDLPVILHIRDAMDDVLAVLSEAAGDDGLCGVAHCFCGDVPTAQQLVELGLYISFSGILTYPSAGTIKAAAQVVPEDRLLVETDCPYLSPQPVRNVKPNEPAHVRHTLTELAALRGWSLEEADRITTENACRLFRL